MAAADVSMENVLDAASSTDKLNAVAVSTRALQDSGRSRNRKPLWLLVGLVLAVLVTAGSVVGALIAKNVIHVSSKSTKGVPSAAAAGSDSSSGDSSAASSTQTTSAAQATSTPDAVVCTNADDIPSASKDTWTDPTSWLDLTDFNCTFTDQMVGGLPLAGLNSTWDDSKQANSKVPPLNKPWGSYGSQPIRGVNLGGWLSLEPFITPSLFDSDSSIGDEYGLCAKLGPKEAAKTLEKHYSTFITEDDFKSIADAGLDHVRIPFSYWAVKTFDQDPYVLGVSWRYLLRGIEWARKYGLRVKLDLHGVPGSQNGWNHSGKQGKVDWLTGPDGPTNAQRTLDIHSQLSKFFAQDRYKNVIAFYGLVNEPALSIPQDDLVTWTQQAYKIVHDNGVQAVQVFSESMRGLAPWQGKLTGYGDSLAIDVHEYTLFDGNLLELKHVDRVNFACKSWTDQVTSGMDTSSGFGPTMVGEWSQADTDCTKHLNGVNNGARWNGTFGPDKQPQCPTQDSQCTCDMDSADPSTFTSDYKSFLLTWAEAQMFAFEKSWGWFYWTWKTESAPLWSYQDGLKGNYMPPLAYQRDWDCSKAVPSFGGLPEYY